jgi:ParB family chromosome partitioning protein
MIVQTIPLDSIDPDPDQPRREVNEQDVTRLALSIRERKLLQPPIVFRIGDRFQIIDGHQRFQALLKLRAQEVPAIVLSQRPDADTLLETQLTANCLRTDMSPLDKANAYQRLMKSRGWNHSELATRLHLSKGTVSQCLSYLKLPQDAQEALQNGGLAESTAYAIARAPDGETQQTMLEAAKQGKLTRDEAQQAVRKRPSRSGGNVRIICQLAETTVTVTSQKPVGFGELQELWRRLSRECKRAANKQWDIPTWQRVLAQENGSFQTVDES